MSRAPLLLLLLGSCAAPGAAGDAPLPGLYYRLLEAGTEGLDARLAAEGVKNHAGAVLAAAVLYASPHPANPCRGDSARRDLAFRAGDLLAAESEAGSMQWLNHRWLLAPWMDAWRLLEKDLGDERRARWRREIEKNVRDMAGEVAERERFPRYASPYIRTSPNHLSIWSSTLHFAGRLFGNPEWEALGGRVMRRFATEEQTADGYWGEHSEAGPTTGYNFLTAASMALYWEKSGDPEALKALRRATDFHTRFTWPDGTPVEVVNDRNRHGAVTPWGHFGFSNFPDGRRYAEFLSERISGRTFAGDALGRVAQNALYWHAGTPGPLPQDQPRFAYRMKVPAGIRKEGPWMIAVSGLISTQSVRNQFYLDRQGHLSIYHAKAGLIVNGANSKRQPELATFSERIQGQTYHLPMSSRFEMGESADRLALSYNSFWAELSVAARSESALEVNVSVTEMGRIEEAQMQLQLCLKGGETLETAKDRIVLGAERVERADLGGWIRHRGWTLKVDPAARLVWPVFPFNPYANGPETRLEHAVGVLAVPLRPQPPREPGRKLRTQEIRFELEVR